MTDPKTQRLFLWIDRAFYLIWLCFPVMIWLFVQAVQNAPAELAALAPDQAACLQALPQVAFFSTSGTWVFWTVFGIQMLFYTVLLALAHQVVHRCATGRVFVAAMIVSLRRIGIIIAAFPFVDLVMQNLSLWAYVKTGDLLVFLPSYALDVPVIGVGLLLVTMAAAMRMAVDMHSDAELTI